MEITLRKAAALESALQAAAKSIALTKTVTISVYSNDDVSSVISEAQAKLTSNAADATNLIKAAFDIRAAIASANAANGVNALLTEKASLDAAEKIITSVSKAAVDVYVPLADATIAEAQLNALRERMKTPEVRHISDSITVNILTNEIAETLRTGAVSMQRRKVAIADELLAKNMAGKIKLGADTVALLEKFNLV